MQFRSSKRGVAAEHNYIQLNSLNGACLLNISTEKWKITYDVEREMMMVMMMTIVRERGAIPTRQWREAWK